MSLFPKTCSKINKSRDDRGSKRPLWTISEDHTQARKVTRRRMLAFEGIVAPGLRPQRISGGEYQRTFTSIQAPQTKSAPLGITGDWRRAEPPRAFRLGSLRFDADTTVNSDDKARADLTVDADEEEQQRESDRLQKNELSSDTTIAKRLIRSIDPRAPVHRETSPTILSSLFRQFTHIEPTKFRFPGAGHCETGDNATLPAMTSITPAQWEVMAETALAPLEYDYTSSHDEELRPQPYDLEDLADLTASHRAIPANCVIHV
ncbi:hypothetical protein J7T55_014754 [Diaporthe amygdali]|uniref:uncharacterized protein n=1 Tax=Phomopsis amygdali TaxID=1214568 RepID=UPI0022FE89D7|nr:uncharacterized protein J7T55_014754 [Diaporthe amygdali]KAJ0109952.1 hypothetical protein J7T55_014754 [Diaporthe amygdali]